MCWCLSVVWMVSVGVCVMCVFVWCVALLIPRAVQPLEKTLKGGGVFAELLSVLWHSRGLRSPVRWCPRLPVFGCGGGRGRPDGSWIIPRRQHRLVYRPLGCSSSRTRSPCCQWSRACGLVNNHPWQRTSVVIVGHHGQHELDGLRHVVGGDRDTHVTNSGGNQLVDVLDHSHGHGNHILVGSPGRHHLPVPLLCLGQLWEWKNLLKSRLRTRFLCGFSHGKL